MLALMATWVYPVVELPTQWTGWHASTRAFVILVCMAFVMLIVLLKTRMTWRELSFLAPGIAVNIIFAQTSNVLDCPLLLDTIGTVVIAVSFGPYAGAATGVATSLVLSAISPANLAFVSIQAFVGFVSGVAARIGGFRTPGRAVVTGFIMGIQTAILASPLNAIVYQDLTNGLQSVIHENRHLGMTMFEAILGRTLVFDPIDKGLSFVIAWSLLTVWVAARRYEAAGGFDTHARVATAVGAEELVV